MLIIGVNIRNVLHQLYEIGNLNLVHYHHLNSWFTNSMGRISCNYNYIIITTNISTMELYHQFKVIIFFKYHPISFMEVNIVIITYW